MSERFPLALPDGYVLNGQYELEEVLGQGGFGITYRALDRKNDRQVAVKEYFPQYMASRQDTNVEPYTDESGEDYEYGKECFLKEAGTLAQFIGNPNIVRLYTYFEENGTAYFVMEYIRGKTFREYISERGGRISWEDATHILFPVMDALAAVHENGIVHRDVTPDNIYVTEDGGVKLLDFGAARFSTGNKSKSMDVVLKHGYAPKEQYAEHGRQGPFTDIYSLGATFYFALTGRRLPDSVERMDEDTMRTLAESGAELPAQAEKAIMKALSVQPADRFQSMEEFRRGITESWESAEAGSGAAEDEATVAFGKSRESGIAGADQQQSGKEALPPSPASENGTSGLSAQQENSGAAPAAATAGTAGNSLPGVQHTYGVMQTQGQQKPAGTDVPKVSAHKISAVLILVIVILLGVIAAGSIVWLKPTIERQNAYRNAIRQMAAGEYEEAIDGFIALGDYKDAAERAKRAAYEQAVALAEDDEYEDAIKLLEELGKYEDAEDILLDCKYGYVQAHLDADSRRTKSYLDDLTDAGYKGAEELYDQLYQWKAEIYFNTSEEATNRQQRFKRTDYFYAHITLSGGPPGGTVYPSVKWVFPSTENHFSFPMEYEAGSVFWANAWLNDPDAKTGTVHFYVYDENGNEIGAAAFELTE